MKSRIIYYIKQHNGIPPIPQPQGGLAITIMYVIESLLAMISRLMCKTASHALISDTERHIKIILTYYEEFDKANRTSSEVPGWIASYNFCSLLNLPSIIREFGPLCNLWEGGGMGEKILRYVKKDWNGLTKLHTKLAVMRMNYKTNRAIASLYDNDSDEENFIEEDNSTLHNNGIFKGNRNLKRY